MAKTNAVAGPPNEVSIEFLRWLQITIRGMRQTLIPVLRGSLLLQHWFGRAARPAADIDFECFALPREALDDIKMTNPEYYKQHKEGYGYYGEFESVVDLGKAMCRYAADSTRHYQWRLPPGPRPDVEFEESDVPEDGESLWGYGTPGERYYTGWIWHERDGVRGRLQIDLAHPAVYDVADIAVADIRLTDSKGVAFCFPAYTQEMLLAAKLSWLLRGLKLQDERSALEWNGELKDLFDAHLLVTRGKLRADRFEKSMLAVTAEDKLDWKMLDALSDLRQPAMKDTDFPGWPGFQQAFPEAITHAPAEMLRVVAERVDPLLAGIRAHVPFLSAIDAEPVDEVPYLIYADWLQEKGDSRGDFLRLAIRWVFHENELSANERTDIRQALKLSLNKMTTPWLYHLFGSAERCREFKQRIEAN